MNLYEVLYPYFYKLQLWHLAVGAGLLFFMSDWHLQKKKLDQENADLIAYDEAMKKIEKEKKENQRRGKP